MIDHASGGAGNPAPPKPLLALTGQYQNGKSTLLNCLLDGMYAEEGNGVTTTKSNARYIYGESREMRIILPDGTFQPMSLNYANKPMGKIGNDFMLQISAHSPILTGMDILDSPGCGANQEDDQAAERGIHPADFVAYLVQKELGEEDIVFLKKINKKRKYYTVILNCHHDKSPEDVEAVCKTIMAKITSEHLDMDYVPLSDLSPVYPVNLLWAQCALGYLSPEEHREKWKKIKVYWKQEDIKPLYLLEKSNFSRLRSLLSRFVPSFFNYPPARKMPAFSTIINSLSSELGTAFKEKSPCQ